MKHIHATILSNATTSIIYSNFLDSFHLYKNMIKSVHYSQHVNKEVSFQISSNGMLYRTIVHILVIEAMGSWHCLVSYHLHSMTTKGTLQICSYIQEVYYACQSVCIDEQFTTNMHVMVKWLMVLYNIPLILIQNETSLLTCWEQCTLVIMSWQRWKAFRKLPYEYGYG